MNTSAEFAKYFDKVLNFLSYRARSQYEIEYYMLRKNWSEEIRKEIIEKLKRLKLIDDENFARQWIAARTFGRTAGKKLIVLELKKKGVAKEIIDKLTAEQRGSSSEEMLAEKIAKKRMERLKKMPFFEKKSKLYSFLIRRGFGFEVAGLVIDKLLKKE